jgi:hypothetical protein
MSRHISEINKVIREAIWPNFGETLSASGFVETDSKYDSEAFGNVTVVFQSRDLRLRFCTDRGDLYVDVSRVEDAPEWHNLAQVLLAMGLIGTKPSGGLQLVDGDPKVEGRAFGAGFPQIVEMFKVENYAATCHFLDDHYRNSLEKAQAQYRKMGKIT